MKSKNESSSGIESVSSLVSSYSSTEKLNSRHSKDTDKSNLLKSQGHNSSVPISTHQQLGSEGKVMIMTKYIFLEKPVSMVDVFPFIVVFFVYGLIIQTLLTIWKKVHTKSHNLFLLFLVVILPPILFFCSADVLFCAMWLVFVGMMASCLKRAAAYPMPKETPKDLYRTFKYLFFHAYAGIFVGQMMTIFSFILYLPLLVPSLRILFYSVYFAVLAREVIMNLSHLMASKTGFFSKEGIPGLSDNSSLCMICTDSLCKDSKTITLSCGHNYHEECIKGWFMVGQNPFCPYCKKGIEKSHFSCDFWDKAELSFRPIMNLIRSFVSYFIITFFYLIIKMKKN